MNKKYENVEIPKDKIGQTRKIDKNKEEKK